MSPSEIIEAYNVIAQSTNDYVEQEAAKIGNSQRSLGTLAERVASPSGQTSGLANYTYDRTLRPVVDTLTTELVTKGKAQALQNTLDTALRDAKNNYERARNTAATAPTTTSPTTTPYTETTDTAYTGEQQPYIAKGTVISIGQQSSAHGLDGKMPWDIVVADGKGGQTMVTVWGKTKDDALSSYYGQTGSGGYGVSGGGAGGGGGGWSTSSPSNSLLDTWYSSDIRNARR